MFIQFYMVFKHYNPLNIRHNITRLFISLYQNFPLEIRFNRLNFLWIYKNVQFHNGLRLEKFQAGFQEHFIF